MQIACTGVFIIEIASEMVRNQGGHLGHIVSCLGFNVIKQLGTDSFVSRFFFVMDFALGDSTCSSSFIKLETDSQNPS